MFPPIAIRFASLVLAAAFALPGCIKDDHSANDMDASDSAATADTSLAADATPVTGADVAGTDATATVVVFKAKCDAAKACATAALCVNGVCVSEPTPDLKAAIADPDKDHTDSAEPIQLGCIGQNVDDAVKGLPDVKTVTIWGRVDRFGGGPVTADIEVAVFKFAEFHPEACAGLTETEAVAACYGNEAKVGKPIAKTVSVAPGQAAANGLAVEVPKKAGEVCKKHFDCPVGYECRKDSGATNHICLLTHGVYAIEGIPTNTRLILRVRGAKAGSKWHDSYLWDYVLFSDRLDPKGTTTQPSKYVGKDTYRVNPTLVGDGQWTTFPPTAGVDSIEEGFGVIGGRVRDCGVPGGRGGWAVHNAKVGLGNAASGMAFFNDNEDDTVPVKTRSATDTFGRYAAVDVPPGPNRVAVAGLVAGKVTPMGSADVYVIPNALVIVSLPGRIPILGK